MKPFSEWLERKPAGPKPKKRLPKKTPRRAKADREYSVRRKQFLSGVIFCQAYDAINLHLYRNDYEYWLKHCPPVCPIATQVHHTKKPKCKYLNDETTWLAVSFWSHQWIEDHKKTARLLNLLS